MIKVGTQISEKNLKKLGITCIESKSDIDKIDNHLGKILKDRQISKYNLAKAIGITRQNVTLIINKKSEPSISTCLKIAKYLDLKVEDIFTLKESNWGKFLVEGTTGKTLIYDRHLQVVIYEKDVKNKNEFINAKTKEIILENSTEVEKTNEVLLRYVRLYQKITPQKGF